MSHEFHIPVLAEELLNYIPLSQKNGVYLDGTFGLGGHSCYLSSKLPSDAKIIGLEWDERLKEYHSSMPRNPMINVFYDSFRQFDFVLASQGIPAINGALLDLGFSSVHIDDDRMGFSFQKDGDLDMRYSQDLERNAADVVNTTPEKELARILFRYGEEPLSKKVAREIVRRRNKQPFRKVLQLVDFLKEVLPSGKGYPWKGIRRIFQAIRIEVNQELQNLESFLKKITSWFFQKNDWLAIISYHSLEDRMVKQHFKELTRECVCPEEEVVCRCEHVPDFVWVKKIIKPSSKEVEENPRSASARMRIICRQTDVLPASAF